MSLEVKQYKDLKYVIRYPEDFDENKKYPTILFLHGAGSRGNDIGIIKCYSLLEKMPKDAPFITILPQCYADTWFEIFEKLIDFASEMRLQKFVDLSRFYLMGNSMGSYASWQLAMTKPEWFTALIPICGGGMYWNAEKLKNIPIWAFHGMQDDVVFVEESVKMVNAVNKNGGNAKLTLYENSKHDSWTETFENPEIYSWLLKQTKK